MSKVIGIAAEGPTDYLVLKTVIDTITGENNRFLALQPEPDMMGRYGNGWKGVWKWCKENSSLEKIMDEIQPKIDVIIIQMDGDVVRKEKEVHCQCDSTDCEEKGKVFPLYCQKEKEVLCTSVSYLADGIEAELTEEEEELLSVFNSLGSAALKKVAIDQMKLLVGLK